MTKPTRVVFSLGNEVRISPPIWPEGKLLMQPGDLSIFAPPGTGSYGYQKQSDGNPFTDAPAQAAIGGVVYFDNNILDKDFTALMRILGVQSICTYAKALKDYAVFVKESEDPGKDGYLTQMRIVSKFALRHMFGAITDAEYESFPDQKLDIEEALSIFMNQEAARWGTSFMQDEEKGLSGLFGGDGNNAREQLSFGFMAENDYYQIFRIWSRAWLVTK